MTVYLGIDFGTSGARAVVIDSVGTILAETQYPFPIQAITIDTATHWQKVLFALIEQIPQSIKGEINAIAINGTSATVFLCDRRCRAKGDGRSRSLAKGLSPAFSDRIGQPVDAPILYNDPRGVAVMEQLRTIAPPNHVVLSATSSLAKLLWWYHCTDLISKSCAETNPLYFLHQADWLAFLLHGKLGISDYHNALKLGYNPENLCYPDWLKQLPVSSMLPNVLAPGTPVDFVTPEVAHCLGLSPDCLVCTGTTDSIAAFIASGAKQPGEAVTSLGSTLVLKLLSTTRVEEAKFGIYSHRLGNLWLTGGASNTGGAVLRHFFSDRELESLSAHIDPEQESPLDYYPLLRPGDRFPINDPELPPRLEPKPDNSVEFLQGILESIARIEARGYRLLQQLGASPLTCVYTAGGGAKNPTWTRIRERQLMVPMLTSLHTAAAYGTALLAKQGCLLDDRV